MSDELVKAEALAVLRSMYPNTTIPEPEAFYFPRWLSDPLYRGSYSNWPSSFLRDHHTNLRATVGQRLWFGGEATSFKYYGRSRNQGIPYPESNSPTFSPLAGLDTDLDCCSADRDVVYRLLAWSIL